MEPFAVGRVGGMTLVSNVANRSNSFLTRFLVRGKCRIRNVLHHSSSFGANHVRRLCLSR